MHIAVDARQLFRQNRRGIGKSLRLLMMYLSRQNPSWTFDLYHRSKSLSNADWDLSPNSTAHYLSMVGDRYDLWERFRLPMATSVSRAELLYSPANTSPRFGLIPSVVSIYDLIPLEMDPHSSKTIAWAKVVRNGAKRARRIHTASVYSANQLIKHFNLSSSKIEIIPLAADPMFSRVEDSIVLNEIRSKYCIPLEKPYVLAFGAEDPRKNTKRIIEAWSHVSNVVRRKFQLAIVGIQPNYIETVKKHARALLSADTYTISGFADESDLPGLISGAEVLCYPSITEGFGLPVLEAFGCKTAVITSNTTSLAEVGQEDAILVDPSSTDSIADALDLLLSNDELRQEYKSKGYIKSLRYNWTQIASDFSLLFNSVL